jgi:hypothetical protein
MLSTLIVPLHLGPKCFRNRQFDCRLPIPSLSNNCCIRFVPSKWNFPVSEPFLFTTRCGHLNLAVRCIHCPTYHPCRSSCPSALAYSAIRSYLVGNLLSDSVYFSKKLSFDMDLTIL